MRRVFLFAALILAAWSASWATITVSSRSGAVWVGNTLVLRVDSPSVGDLVANRLKQVLLSQIPPSRIGIDRYGRDYALHAGGLPIIVVTPYRARLNHTDARSLAFLWASRLKDAIIHGTYLVTPTRLVIPAGESRPLSITGRYPGGLSVEVKDPDVSNLTNDDIPLIFKGLKPGSTKVRISVGNLSAYTDVVVKEWAGTVPEKTVLVVTGQAVPRSFLRRAVARLLNQKIGLQPDARISYSMPAGSLPFELTAGENMIFPVRTIVYGPDYLTVNKSLIMQIEDKTFAPTPPATLIVSNNPENFTGPGTLLKKSFSADGPFRIFFHHHNKGSAPYRLTMNLENLSDEPVYLHVSQGVAGPDANELQVGEAAAYQFLSSLRTGLGEVIEIGPNETYPLISKRVPPQESYSGMLLLTPLGADQHPRFTLQAEVEPLKPGETPSGLAINEEEKRKPRGIFNNPEIDINASYSIGGNYTFIEIGKDDILTDPDTGMPDFGNYGVLYKINVTINNPSSTEQKAHIMFVPQAGPAEGVFLMDGGMVPVPFVEPFTPYPLDRLTLKPGETRSVVLETIPLGGSFYPVDLVVEP